MAQGGAPVASPVGSGGVQVRGAPNPILPPGHVMGAQGRMGRRDAVTPAMGRVISGRSRVISGSSSRALSVRTNPNPNPNPTPNPNPNPYPYPYPNPNPKPTTNPNSNPITLPRWGPSHHRQRPLVMTNLLGLLMTRFVSRRPRSAPTIHSNSITLTLTVTLARSPTLTLTLTLTLSLTLAL